MIDFFLTGIADIWVYYSILVVTTYMSFTIAIINLSKAAQPYPPTEKRTILLGKHQQRGHPRMKVDVNIPLDATEPIE
jgi:hypothetical protein